MAWEGRAGRWGLVHLFDQLMIINIMLHATRPGCIYWSKTASFGVADCLTHYIALFGVNVGECQTEKDASKCTALRASISTK